MSTSSSKKTLFLVRFAILLALEAIVCFTPLGSIRIPFTTIVATMGMIPVIITAIVLGPKAGSAMGFFAGLFSFLVWTFAPPGPEAFVFTPFYSVGGVHGSFWSLVICFVPRILVGAVAGLVFRALSKRTSPGGKVLAYALAGLCGSMANTIGVLGGIYIFFGPDYAAAYGLAYEGLLALVGLTIAVNGTLEAVMSTVLASVICQPLRKMVVRPARG